MIKAIKIQTLLWITAAAVLTISALCLIISAESESEPAFSDGTGRIIVVDPGHGGRDGGASVGDVLEKELNLAVALKLRDIINEGGDTAVMTRESDEIQMLGSTGDKYIKKADLDFRLSKIEESGADIFVSIHMNKFTNPKYSGAQVFHADNPDSTKLGEAIQLSLKSIPGTENTRSAKGNEAGIYILKKSGVPAALVECGFISNPEELEKLRSEEYRTLLANAIYDGICAYFN